GAGNQPEGEDSLFHGSSVSLTEFKCRTRAILAGALEFVVIRSGDFNAGGRKACFWVIVGMPGSPRIARQGAELRYQPGFFPQWNCLCPPPGAELIKKTAGMRLDCILAEKELIRDFTVVEPACDQAKNLQFAGSDAELGQTFFVGDKGT